MAKSKRQKYLEKELRKEKNKSHNKIMKNNAQVYKQELIKKATLAEKALDKALSESPIHDKYEFQYIIYDKKNKKIEKFYIADFCFPDFKLIIELDGEYHFTAEQQEKDIQRTKHLKRLGYRVYRFTNNQILKSKDIQGLVRWIITKLLK